MLCSSSFADMMENYNHHQQQQQQQGDLADIVRAGGGSGGGVGTSSGLSLSDDDWLQFPSDNIITLNDDFGDPFSNNFRHHPSSSSSSLFNNNNNNDHDHDHDHHSTSTCTSSSSTAPFFTNNNPHGFLAGGGFRPPSNNNNNIFSRMLQISPSVPPSCEPNPTVVTGGLLLKVASSGGGSNLVENGVVAAAAGVQISSPRNAGIKRRKSQAKKVVCIPAPTPANSRPSGEVVPSDLWAWRKYGQKPIKGSPYPRGYYRCSSSKGCSARKQVERSRTDPNMLVITYTSEHNHPWPTQRNALAGSTRAQPNKAGSGSKSSNTGSQTHKEVSNNTNELEDEKDKPNISLENPLFDNSLVKEENMDEQMDMEGCGDVFGSEGFDFHSTYKPALQDSSHCEDLFADLGEIETDSLSLLFSQGFDQDRDGGNKGNMLDHFFDWAGNINNKQP